MFEKDKEMTEVSPQIETEEVQVTELDDRDLEDVAGGEDNFKCQITINQSC